VLSGAHQFLEQHPEHKITLRTTDQFNELDDSARWAMIKRSDLMFLGGVFGDSVPLMLRVIDSNPALHSLVAIHSDRRLVTASKIKGHPLLAGANLDELMAKPPTNIDATQWSKSQLALHPQHKDWLLAKAFWANRETDNIDGLLRHLISLSGERITAPPPKIRSPLRVYVEGNSIEPEQLSPSKSDKFVAIVDYETGSRPGEKELIDQLCQQIQAESALKCLVLLAKWGPASVEASALLTKHKSHITSVISLQNFVLGGGEGRTEVTSNFTQLDVPILKGIRLSDRTAAEYLVSEEGLHWDSVHYRVAMPE
jgi:cobaltochelatase CobN